MIIVLLLICMLIVSIIISIIKIEDRRIDLSIPCFMIFLILIVIPTTIGASYKSYLGDRVFYDSVYSQYRGNITLYKDHITIIPPAVTDFTGQTYAKEMSDKINSLQNKIVRYNTSVIQKRILKKNIIFSWLIIAPDDDMKTMNIIN